MTLKTKNEIIHRQKGDFSIVRNLQLFGTNEEIGFELGKIAKHQHNIARTQNTDTLKHNAQKKYLKENYPIHYSRMRGLAKAYSEDIDTTKFDFTCLGNPMSVNACSAAYYPPSVTESGAGILSRNLDLPTISFSEMITGISDTGTPAVSNIYIVEMYPDRGYSSIVNLSFELYGLGLDGINSEGLTVTHLYADSVNAEEYRPAREYGVGINEMLAVQLLLDNCKTVDEAKETLLYNKHFYLLLPTHFLIADRFGKSFIWEYSSRHNKEYITDGNDKTQIITNFLVHEFPDPDNFPESKDSSCPFHRYTILKKSVEDSGGKHSTDEIKEINSRVFIKDDINSQNKVRTIYHNIYDTGTKSMEISFYRKDNGRQQLRTPYFKFRLE